MEEGLVVLIGATTENPFFAVNARLLSRSTLWRLEPLSDDDLAEVVRRGLDGRGGRRRARRPWRRWCRLADGDARAALTTLEVAVALAGDGDRCHRRRTWSGPGPAGCHHYGDDAHYDQVSALIKSVRGSDPDAGLYWLARMLEAGEDARFIARRLVILASEDVGLADPLALVVADAAARAVEFVGLPEAQLNLAQAVVHLACAPKSNRVTVALGRAQGDVREGPRGDVPTHLRDATTGVRPGIGHGEGYVYPHDEPGGWVDQQYRPAEVAGHGYYEPSDRGTRRRWPSDCGSGARRGNRVEANPRSGRGPKPPAAGVRRGTFGAVEGRGMSRSHAGTSGRLPMRRGAVGGTADRADGRWPRPASWWWAWWPPGRGWTPVRRRTPPRVQPCRWRLPSVRPDAGILPAGAQVVGPAAASSEVTADVSVEAAGSGGTRGLRQRGVHAGLAPVPSLSARRQFAAVFGPSAATLATARAWLDSVRASGRVRPPPTAS